MSAVDAAIPEAGKPDVAKLAAIDADTLVRYVIDNRRPWWRRRPCVEALRDRVPEASVARLHEVIRDGSDVSEVRVALLGLVGDRGELLPFLQTLSAKDHFGIYEHGLAARGRIGDLSAAPELARIASSLWQSRAECGERGLDALVDRHGSAAVLDTVGLATPEARTAANRIRSREHGDLTAALADDSVLVARRAAELMVATGRPDDEHLRDLVVTGATTDVRLWAAYVLHRRGHDIRELWHAIDAPRVEVPWLPEAARLAILREYPGELGTDPRWLVERACVELPEEPDQQAHLAHVIATLQAAGLAAGEPVSAVAQNGGVGSGNYYEISTTNGSILVSMLGPFASGGWDSWDGPGRERQVLEAAGFLWIDDELGQRNVDKLAVYYFGNRDPIAFHTLLFYWQD